MFKIECGGVMDRHRCLLLAGLLMLAGCAPALTPAGARVEKVSQEIAEGCERLGLVEGISPFAASSWSEDGPSSVNFARNHVAARGGNAMLVQIDDRLMAYGRGYRYLTRVEALNCTR
jgi:hypothetical protein